MPGCEPPGGVERARPQGVLRPLRSGAVLGRTCPKHGDVTAPRRRYVETGKITDEDDYRARRKYDETEDV